MIDLKQQCMVADHIVVNFSEPGYYSGKVNSNDGTITLEKVSESFIDVKDVKNFCKYNKYRVEPYLIENPYDIPTDWELNTNVELNEEF